MRPLDVLAVGAHPDDVELGCGGTLALLARRGRRVGVLHLSAGERGTRGTSAQRRREADAAARALGAEELAFLDCGDGGMRPELVLAPPPADRHPDHGRAHALLRDACFYAGLARRGAGEPHRPAAVFSYMQHDPFVPSFLVDVSEVWEIKEAALAAYGSQLYQPGQPQEGPATKIGSRQFREAVAGRAAHYGMLLGVERAEAFWSPTPLAVADPMDLLPRGLR